MAVDPLRQPDRILQKASNRGDIHQSIKLIDVDSAIMKYLQDVALPKLSDNGAEITIPVLYGNAERWNGARRDGVYRDLKGKIQLPMMMLKRTGVAKNAAIPMLNRQVSYATIKKYSKDNRYDRFSLMGGQQTPKYELYNIIMPDYVEITYDCMAWTSFTEQLNTVIESMTFASDEYWGDKTKFKFNTIASNFDVITDVTTGAERVNRVQFSLTVKAYLLPEKFDGQPTTKKSYSVVRIVTEEIDITSGESRLEEILSSPSPYYDNKDLVDFLSLNNTTTQNPVVIDTITFVNTKPIAIPSVLSSSISSTMTLNGVGYDIKLYINGVRYFQGTHFTAAYTLGSNTLVITFLPAGLGFDVQTTDNVTITGRFLKL
jgi:hypothetical protein